MLCKCDALVVRYKLRKYDVLIVYFKLCKRDAIVAYCKLCKAATPCGLFSFWAESMLWIYSPIQNGRILGANCDKYVTGCYENMTN